MKKSTFFSRLFQKFFSGRQAKRHSKTLLPISRFAIISVTCLTLSSPFLSLEEQRPSENSNLQPSSSPFDSPNFNYYILDPPEFEPGRPYKVTVSLQKDKKEFSFLLVKLPSKKICAVGCKCPYDGQTDLSEGLVAKNKLICPEHGCEFDVLSGLVEHPPALDSLPIFGVSQVKLEGHDAPKLKISLPHFPPSKILPMAVRRIEQDFRKIAVVGAGAAGLGAAETLRKMFFAGEINVFTWDESPPLQRQNLTKFTTLKGNEPFIFFRSNDYWKERDVGILAGRKVKRVEISDDYGFVELEEGSKYFFDAIVLASGANGRPQFDPQLLGRNLITLDTLADFKRAQALLPQARRVAINGLTLGSLQLASTLRRDFPELEVDIFQQSPGNPLKEELGKEVHEALVAGLRKQGVKFHLNHKLQTYEQDENRQVISRVFYGSDPDNLKSVPSDIVYNFEPNLIPNTGFINFKNYIGEVERNEIGQIDVNELQRTRLNFVFAAGSCSATNDGANHLNIRWPSFADSYFQGEIAAYNIMGLSIPNNRTTFNYYSILGKTFQSVGTKITSDHSFLEGDKSALKFISYYADEGRILSAFGSREYSKELAMIKEALNSGYVLSIDNLKENREAFFARLLKNLNEDKIVACRRQIIFDKRGVFNPRQSIWKERENLDELYEKKFKNLKPKVI